CFGSQRWSTRLKFDDERVTKEDMKRALDEKYGGEKEESMSVIISITKKCFCCDSWAQPSFEDVLWNLQYDAEVQANAQGPAKTPLFMGC
ncbi:hypothetical protein Tco_1305817, partial [Tanacetum coccineum]